MSTHAWNFVRIKIGIYFWQYINIKVYTLFLPIVNIDEKRFLIIFYFIIC